MVTQRFSGLLKGKTGPSCRVRNAASALVTPFAHCEMFRSLMQRCASDARPDPREQEFSLHYSQVPRLTGEGAALFLESTIVGL